MSRKILIIGGSGFVSGTLARIALEQGFETWVLTRDQRPAPAGAQPSSPTARTPTPLPAPSKRPKPTGISSSTASATNPTTRYRTSRSSVSARPIWPLSPPTSSSTPPIAVFRKPKRPSTMPARVMAATSVCANSNCSTATAAIWPGPSSAPATFTAPDRS